MQEQRPGSYQPGIHTLCKLTKLAQPVNVRGEQIHKREMQEQQPGPPSLAFTELSNGCREEISPCPNLSFPCLDHSEAPRTVRGSPRTLTVHTTVLLLSPELTTPAARAEIMFCSSLRWFLPHYELSEDVSLLPIFKSSPCRKQRCPLQENPRMYKRHLQVRHNFRGEEGPLNSQL